MYTGSSEAGRQNRAIFDLGTRLKSTRRELEDLETQLLGVFECLMFRFAQKLCLGCGASILAAEAVNGHGSSGVQASKDGASQFACGTLAICGWCSFAKKVNYDICQSLLRWL